MSYKGFDSTMEKCTICKKNISFATYERSKYAHKGSTKNGITKYACSYSCFCKLKDTGTLRKKHAYKNAVKGESQYE